METAEMVELLRDEIAAAHKRNEENVALLVVARSKLTQLLTDAGFAVDWREAVDRAEFDKMRSVVSLDYLQPAFDGDWISTLVISLGGQSFATQAAFVLANGEARLMGLKAYQLDDELAKTVVQHCRDTVAHDHPSRRLATFLIR